MVVVQAEADMIARKLMRNVVMIYWYEAKSGTIYLNADCSMIGTIRVSTHERKEYKNKILFNVTQTNVKIWREKRGDGKPPAIHFPFDHTDDVVKAVLARRDDVLARLGHKYYHYVLLNEKRLRTEQVNTFWKKSNKFTGRIR